MNKQGSLVISLLIMLVVVVVTSAVVLVLVKIGALSVGNEDQQPVLNAEFIPFERDGEMVLRSFSFCGDVNTRNVCVDERNFFLPGESVYFLFFIETSVESNEVLFTENYRLTDPNGDVILQMDEGSAFHSSFTSSEDTELVAFKDHLILGYDAIAGEYTLDLVVENPLVGKKAVVTRRFTVEDEAEYGSFEE
jgi:hypothetical protein